MNEYLKQMIEMSGLKNSDIAYMSDTPLPMLSQWKSGERDISFKKLCQIAKAIDFEIKVEIVNLSDKIVNLPPKGKKEYICDCKFEDGLFHRGRNCKLDREKH